MEDGGWGQGWENQAGRLSLVCPCYSPDCPSQGNQDSLEFRGVS